MERLEDHPKRPPDVLGHACPSHRVPDTIAGKRSVLILRAPGRGAVLRCGELQRTVSGIGQKTPAQTLGNLERNGLVERTAYPVIPLQVEYPHTPLGESLKRARGGLCRRSPGHVLVVAAASEAASRDP